MNARGFTLLEVLVALAIAATALVALSGRLGASAEVQRTLMRHGLMQETAIALLQKSRLSGNRFEEKQGQIESGFGTMHWRLWFEKTEIDGFMRQNVEVQLEGEPPLALFLYRAAQP